MKESSDKQRLPLSRNVAYDFIRAVAIMLVILCHATELCYPVAALQGVSENLTFSIGFTLGRLGVPLFLFLTGALVLTKPFNDDPTIVRFYRRNYLTLLITVVCWAGIYYCCAAFVRGEICLAQLIRCVCLVDGAPSIAWWYMPMILGLYIVVPFLGSGLIRGLTRNRN